MSKDIGIPIKWPNYVWINGSVVRWEDAKVHVFVHGLHYGTGAFEGIRGYYDDGVIKVFRLNDHVKRLYNSAKVLHMNIPYDAKRLVEAVIETIKVNRFKADIYIRPIVFRGLGSFGLRALNPVEVAIIALEFGKYLKPTGIRCKISSWRKPQPDSLPIWVKITGMYVLYHLAALEAHLSGYDEAILLDSEGYVAEGAGENIFIVRDGVLITPPVYDGIIEGITRNTVVRIATEIMGLKVLERRIRREEIYTCDEIFFTGTAAEITPIVEVDGITIGSGTIGEITKKIMDLYRDVVLGKIERYRYWITEIETE